MVLKAIANGKKGLTNSLFVINCKKNEKKNSLKVFRKAFKLFPKTWFAIVKGNKPLSLGSEVLILT